MTPKINALFLMDAEVMPLVYGPAEQRELAQIVTFAAPPLSATTLGSYAGDLREVQAVFSGWGVPYFDGALLAKLPSCEIVFHAAGTARTFLTPTFWERSVRLTTAAEANAVPVAEYTLAAVVFCLKHVWQRIFDLRERGKYLRTDATMPGAFGSTVGLLALSRIGREVAARLRALDIHVIAYDPVADPQAAAALDVELCSLNEVFARADVVSCHLPLLPATTALLRASHFARMKPGASFINTARGGVVDESAMIAVLRARPDLFAVLDVVSDEPVPAHSPLLALPNVIVTPHVAGSLGPECRRMGRMMIDEARRYLSGSPLRGEVLESQMAFMA